MAILRRGIHAPGGDRFELRGRFLAHVAQLEFLARMIVAEYLSRSREDDSRNRILHDDLLRHANFTTLTKLIKSIVRDQEEEVAASWAWLPRDLKALAEKRNAVAHISPPWTQGKDPIGNPEELVALLLKVDAGLAGFGSTLSWIIDPVAPPEEEFSATARERAAAVLRDLEEQRRSGGEGGEDQGGGRHGEDGSAGNQRPRGSVE